MLEVFSLIIRIQNYLTTPPLTRSFFFRIKFTIPMSFFECRLLLRDTTKRNLADFQREEETRNCSEVPRTPLDDDWANMRSTFMN